MILAIATLLVDIPRLENIDLQKEMGLSYIFISQNVDLAKHLSDKVIILKNGEIVEQGPTKDVLFNPQQSYTKKIISFE